MSCEVWIFDGRAPELLTRAPTLADARSRWGNSRHAAIFDESGEVVDTKRGADASRLAAIEAARAGRVAPAKQPSPLPRAARLAGRGARGDRALPPTLRPLPPPEDRHVQRRPTARPSRPCTPPPPAAPLTSRQRILLALASLGEGPATLAALAVRAWERDPSAFGLRGFEATHPDSNRVWAKLSGADGLGALGWCTRPAPAQVEITEKGRRVAAALAKGGAR